MSYKDNRVIFDLRGQSEWCKVIRELQERFVEAMDLGFTHSREDLARLGLDQNQRPWWANHPHVSIDRVICWPESEATPPPTGIDITQLSLIHI